MSSIVSDLVVDAAAMLAATGQVEHLWTSCTPGGAVNVTSDPPCTACQINAAAASINDARERVE